jgi:RNA-directed DNA polymerase
VRGVLMARPYSMPAKAATIIAQLCTDDNQLPQGAPTSPILSNLVCAKLDGDLEALAKRHRLT